MNYYQLNSHMDMMFFDNENRFHYDEIEINTKLYQSMVKVGFDMNDLRWVTKVDIPLFLVNEEYCHQEHGNLISVGYLIKIHNNGIVFLASEQELLLETKEAEFFV